MYFEDPVTDRTLFVIYGPSLVIKTHLLKLSISIKETMKEVKDYSDKHVVESNMVVIWRSVDSRDGVRL